MAFFGRLAELLADSTEYRQGFFVLLDWFGAQAAGLSVRGDPFDADRANIVIDNGASRVDISSALSGGTVGGILDFRREVLDTARNEVGRIAMAFAATVNDQHAAGMDMNGNLGAQFFGVSEPTVLLNSIVSPKTDHDWK